MNYSEENLDASRALERRCNQKRKEVEVRDQDMKNQAGARDGQ